MSSTRSTRSGSYRAMSSTEVELLYAKSKVYLHPTTSKKDNIPGFLTLSRPANGTNLDVLLSFTPENQLSAEERSIYENVDVEDIDLDLQALNSIGFAAFSAEASSAAKTAVTRIIPRPSSSSLSGYSFSAALSFIYSIQVRNPSAGYWYGSLVINTQDGEKFPIVFFHDDESPSSNSSQRLKNRRFDPFDENGQLYWGGKHFMMILEKFVNVQKSTVASSVYLINPESNDLRNFAPFKVKDVPEPNKKSIEPFKLPDLTNVNKFIATAKWKVLETVATITARTKSQVMDIIEDNAPLSVKQIMNKPEVQKIGDEFDSARVYLAKWAQQVKEEAEESQRKNLLNNDIYNKINNELGSNELLTDEEISQTSRRKEINQQEWESFFDYSGRLCLTADEVKSRIFHGGLEDSVRKEAWLFLLGIYPWDSSTEERILLRKSYETAYEELKLRWIEDDDKRATEFWKDQKHRIEKDVNRTDRQLPIFQNPKKSTSNAESGDNATRESSPETPDEEELDDEFDISNIRNPHLYIMREILLTYNEHNLNLGYVQGMTDLLSPLYVTFQDESLTFWAFTKFMQRMERNFVRDQSGMKLQMSTLNKLLQFMLPELYKHLDKCNSIDLFFFFRMLLVLFKRELEWPQVLRLWEILWTDCYSSQFHLFFALAILSDNERIIMQNLKQFDEVLKYMNDLSMTLHLDPLLIRSELLFLKFKRMIDIIDRENSIKKLNSDVYMRRSSSASNSSVKSNEMIEVSDDLRQLLSRELVIQKEVPRPEGVGGG
ncbi:GTPase activating protein [Scheffersomyces stipitis CBS 6054]|uniref:GTPase activating protein n=1 Tax=Scheffersomyces stipitis (strain ATCC 58785 / CBS 6054 / NBRC 10063 / NRRL Y-11545) TaxID=322104 RepID=A3LY82_PICST|nr:GTPase activating protein [Scheffersomyces stipitis CBS 6054]ABN67936.2 GTPase activating protein [Scheffersomyces stipitis CBS 6054]